MTPHPWKVYITFIALALYPAKSCATDVSQCFADITSCANSSSCTLNISSTIALSALRTSQGSPVISVDEATGISYLSCVEYCGSGQEPFSWTVFSQEYSAWLLPYLALLSQLPFGSRRRMDNLMSATLTLGSPVLAGYSLYMTLLNIRWVNDHLFSGIDYPSSKVRQSVVRVLTNLQQVPLRVHPGKSGRFESLVVHPDNDEWWNTFAEELDYSHTWSIASATSITWVIVAYLFTVTDSISNVAGNINNTGEGTGSGWLWLLPIVMGWLIMSPKCDYDRVHDAFHKANRRVFVADSHDRSAAPETVASEFGLTIDPNPDWEVHRNIVSPDESCIPPIFDYARMFPWARNVYITSLFYRAAWRKSIRRVGVDGGRIPGNICNDVPRESRLGTRTETIRYCHPGDDDYPRARVLWPRGVFFNMVVASLMSLLLQWGTTGAAILVVWFTPTIGFGCRSLGYLTNGILSTAVWVLLVSSSTLGYYAHHLVDEIPVSEFESTSEHIPFTTTTNFKPDEPRLSITEISVDIPLRRLPYPANTFTESEDVPLDESDIRTNTSTIRHERKSQWLRVRSLELISDWLRWIGKTIAVFNAIATITNSIFQYAGVYARCYCDSSVFYWGSSAFNVINPTASDIDLTASVWKGALAMSLVCCGIFVGCIYLIRDSFPL